MLHQPWARPQLDPPPDRWDAAMRLGDFETAWRVSDRVLAERSSAASDDPQLPYHLRWLWDGRRFDGRRVLVRCYHGLGDTLQFCRFLAPLRRRARAVTLEVQAELIDLLAQLDGPDELVAFQPAQPLAPSDCDIEIMELSHALRLAPQPIRYLTRSHRPPRSGLRVGLCWQSSPTWLPERSIPPPLLAPLLARSDIEFVSLNRGAAALPGLSDDCPSSIVETARRIAGLDLVISVDTMVAHLAGALGTPLWLLLKAEPDWRWVAGGGASVWYPDVRKFRQPSPGQWEPPLRALLGCLDAAVKGGTLPMRSGFDRR